MDQIWLFGRFRFVYIRAHFCYGWNSFIIYCGARHAHALDNVYPITVTMMTHGEKVELRQLYV